MIVADIPVRVKSSAHQRSSGYLQRALHHWWPVYFLPALSGFGQLVALHVRHSFHPCHGSTGRHDLHARDTHLSLQAEETRKSRTGLKETVQGASD